jgi:hypothetical protein
MRYIRGSTFDECVEWYLLRERRKDPLLVVPNSAPARLEMMRKDHSGKLRDWFERARWSVVVIDAQELENLIYLESNWTKDENLVVNDGPNYRLLGKVADRAINSGYLTKASAKQHLEYYNALKKCHFRLEGSSRLVICSPNDSEKQANPAGQYYLHDGSGRGLSYMILIKENAAMFDPIEVFLAQQ